jgi:hypothetical protein
MLGHQKLIRVGLHNGALELRIVEEMYFYMYAESTLDVSQTLSRRARSRF